MTGFDVLRARARRAWRAARGRIEDGHQPDLGDRVLFDPEDRAEVEVQAKDYVVLRERDIHAVAAARVDDGQTGLYL